FFSRLSTRCSVRFVAFVNEEPPFFMTSRMGSLIYAREARRRGDQILFMACLETIGYYTGVPGSQSYPPLFRFFYPDRGNFIALVSDIRSRGVMLRMARAFRQHSDFPLESTTGVSFIPGIAWSDHAAFWEQGYQAFMVTDTAPFRYPFYHTAEDTPDKVDYPSLARVVAGLGGALAELAGVR
ncbi:MAG: M28 family peptidase, partial [Pseudomonadota bacterium]